MSIFIGSTKIEVPQVSLRFRRRSDAVYRAMKQRGETDIVSIIASNRTSDASAQEYEALIKPSLRDMKFWKMADIDKVKVLVVGDSG